ncbi:protein amnionless [Chanos chanos]|uniref:Protein amnionless n=1 Tax=Chanos chanos TaxID=29144 RepID=A0A6J2WRW5_CHACN|nr:protein amnionless [Chanos chanos]
MAHTQLILFWVCILGSTNALYKRWIPDTNFENATNWVGGVVPCGNDYVQFPAQRKVSVYVSTAHTASGMYLPVDGELILASGAGFAVGNGQDPGCGTGATVTFKDSDSLQWFDPALWQSASSSDDLEKGSFLFSVHEDSVPCHFDDVVFREGSSFRVDISSDQKIVPVKSVSIMGKKFRSNSEFTQYLSSHSGQLQFHGSSSLNVMGSTCNDLTGCECGNSANHDRICQHVTCPHLECHKPLSPTGHCCQICGAIINIKYSESFNLETYCQRLQHVFLGLSKYHLIQLGLSKVSQTQRLLGIMPFGTVSKIQVTILDQGTGSNSGKLAAELARDIMNDAKANGAHLGIEETEIQASSDSSGNSGVIAGAVVGSLLVVICMVLFGFLLRRGIIRVPSIPSLSTWKRNSLVGELGGPLDRGFDNPMFDKPNMMPEIPELYGTDSMNSITMTQSGVHFVNPAYDETEFQA